MICGDFSTYVEWFNSIISTIQNVVLAFTIIATFFMIILAIFSIRLKANKFTAQQLSKLKSEGKYIPGVFVELNETKETLRYFIFRKKWKRRIVERFNCLYNNHYGQILQSGTFEKGVRFRLHTWQRFSTITNSINKAIIFHNRLKDNVVPFRDEYKESRYIFAIYYRQYVTELEILQNFCLAATQKYMVLIGSAGNGKTNLLCSISELIMSAKESVIFINSRDVNGNLEDFIFDKLKIKDFWKKHKKAYYSIVNFVLWIRRQHLFFLIDAVNESDNTDYSKNVCSFINELSRYKRMLCLTSCRSEYFLERFEKNLSTNIEEKHSVLEIKSEDYSFLAIQRIISCYKRHFNYSGNISQEVIHILCSHLLLLRMFFEVYKDQKTDVMSIQKHEVFKAYINQIQTTKIANIEKILESISIAMIEKESFDGVFFDQLTDCTQSELQDAFDETVLLNRKLSSHPNTIASEEKEEVYFVFDEIRDYCLARTIIKNNSSVNTVDLKNILNTLRRIHDASAPCEEGVFHYTYVFLKTDKTIAKKEKINCCKDILAILSQSNPNINGYHPWNSDEYSNLGLKILFSSGLSIDDFEKEFIRECLVKNPKIDGRKLFNDALTGTRIGLPINLDCCFEILFGIEHVESLLNNLKAMLVGPITQEYSLPDDLIPIHKVLIIEHPERAIQIQKAAELFLIMVHLRIAEPNQNISDYFENLPRHKLVRDELIKKIKKGDLNQDE